MNVKFVKTRFANNVAPETLMSEMVIMKEMMMMSEMMSDSMSLWCLLS